MNPTEHWRCRLQELLAITGLSQAAFAARADISPDYMSRLLYPANKAGRKNLGMVTMRKIINAFNLPANWFDEPLGTALPNVAATTNSAESGAQATQQHSVNDIIGFGTARIREPVDWPFTRVTYERINRVRKHFGGYGMPPAMSEIDKLLDVLVTRWENEIRETSHNKSSAA